MPRGAEQLRPAVAMPRGKCRHYPSGYTLRRGRTRGRVPSQVPSEALLAARSGRSRHGHLCAAAEAALHRVHQHPAVGIHRRGHPHVHAPHVRRHLRKSGGGHAAADRKIAPPQSAPRGARAGPRGPRTCRVPTVRQRSCEDEHERRAFPADGDPERRQQEVVAAGPLPVLRVRGFTLSPRTAGCPPEPGPDAPRSSAPERSGQPARRRRRAAGGPWCGAE